MRSAGHGEKWVCGLLRLGNADELVSGYTDDRQVARG